MPHPFTPVFAMLALVVSGCSTSSYIKDIQWHDETELGRYSVVVDVENKSEHGAPYVTDLRSAIISRLTGTGIFRDLPGNRSEGDLKLTVTMTQVRVVSGAARLWGGAWAGENHIHGDVVLTRRSSGKVVGKCFIEGNSAAHPLAGKTTISDAMNEFANSVIEFVAKKGKGAPDAG